MNSSYSCGNNLSSKSVDVTSIGYNVDGGIESRQNVETIDVFYRWKMNMRFLVVLGMVGLLGQVSAEISAQQKKAEPQKVESAKLGNTKNVHRAGNLWFAGQFTQADIEKIKAEGIERVISLRTDGEIDWDEKKALEAAGIQFTSIPFRSPESLNVAVFDSVRKHLKSKDKKILFHCGSAHRVGGVWLPYRVLDEKVPLKTALKEAEKIGLRGGFVQEKAVDYIEKRQ